MKKNFLTTVFTIAAFAILGLSFIAGSASAYDYGTGGSTGGSGSGWDISKVQNYNLPNATVMDIVENILNWLLSIFGIVGVIGFIISGIMYLISAGNDDMIKSAKKGMQYSIYGIIVGLAGLVIIQAIDALLNGAATF